MNSTAFIVPATYAAVRSPAPTPSRSRSRSRSRSLRVARSLARFYEAPAFNQDLSGWVVNEATFTTTCRYFCRYAGFKSTSMIPSFPGTCGNPGC